MAHPVPTDAFLSTQPCALTGDPPPLFLLVRSLSLKDFAGSDTRG